MNPAPAPGESRIEQLADRTFLEVCRLQRRVAVLCVGTVCCAPLAQVCGCTTQRTSPELKGFLTEVVEQATNRLGPSIVVKKQTGVDGVVLLVGYRTGYDPSGCGVTRG